MDKSAWEILLLKQQLQKSEELKKEMWLLEFAGSTADALTLFERLEGKLEKHAGNLSRAAVELAKDWRTDKYLRRLEALMAVGDKNNSYIISGTGDVLEPEGDIIGIGSGGNYALAAGKVLLEGNMSAEEIAKKQLKLQRIYVYSLMIMLKLKNIMDNSNVTQLHPKDKSKNEEASLVSSLSPREIVSELDRL